MLAVRPWTLLQALGVLYAILVLGIGIGDAFVDTSTIRTLMYHSWVFHLFILVIFLPAASFIAARLNKGKEDS